jgi:hypothetical protein
MVDVLTVELHTVYIPYTDTVMAGRLEATDQKSIPEWLKKLLAD